MPNPRMRITRIVGTPRNRIEYETASTLIGAKTAPGRPRITARSNAKTKTKASATRKIFTFKTKPSRTSGRESRKITRLKNRSLTPPGARPTRRVHDRERDDREEHDRAEEATQTLRPCVPPGRPPRIWSAGCPQWIGVGFDDGELRRACFRHGRVPVLLCRPGDDQEKTGTSTSVVRYWSCSAWRLPSSFSSWIPRLTHSTRSLPFSKVTPKYSWVPPTGGNCPTTTSA